MADAHIVFERYVETRSHFHCHIFDAFSAVILVMPSPNQCGSLLMEYVSCLSMSVFFDFLEFLYDMHSTTALYLVLRVMYDNKITPFILPLILKVIYH